MTDTNRIEPDDSRYAAIYNFWRANDMPAICQMSSGKYMKLATDGIIVFIDLHTTDEDYYNTSSTKAISG